MAMPFQRSKGIRAESMPKLVGFEIYDLLNRPTRPTAFVVALYLISCFFPNTRTTHG